MQAKEQNISPIKQRILFFAGTLGISKRDFYAKIGVSRGTLESKTGITEDVITKVFATYPQINIEWLMTGKGEMLADEREYPVEGNPPQQATNQELINNLLNRITEQAAEIGRLREQIEQLKKGRGHNASDANTSEIANVG